MVEDGKYSEVR